MEDRRCFVQFLHPGAEHGPDEANTKHWNIGPHRRKFLVGPGRCLQRGAIRECAITFWGEWEAQSEVEPIPDPISNGPRWRHRPFYDPPVTYRGCQNTDPFVFGEQFHYTGCLQHTKFGPTQMRNLSRGSVIVFGSCRTRSAFVIDTVFVVVDYVDHASWDHRATLAGRISSVYDEVTIKPWYANSTQRDRVHRLYYGATPESPVDGMFSFFPCLPSQNSPRGFAKPEIVIPGLISQRQTQNKKLRCDVSTSELRGWWDEVVRQVEDQGLMLGVHADLPVRLDGGLAEVVGDTG